MITETWLATADDVKVIDCHAPLKNKTVKVRPAVPWYNDEIKAAKRLRSKAERT